MTPADVANLRVQDLQKLLLDFAATNSTEDGFKQRLLQLLERGAQVFGREHYLPGHFTASAFVLSPDRHKVLLIHHKKLQRWLQPGGHFEAEDQTVVAAAAREVREETGLAELELAAPGIFDLDIHKIPARSDAPEHLHFDIRVLFRATSDQVRAGAEVSGVAWRSIAGLNASESDESVARAIAKLL
jgi:8-oxo-dGTP pyrophosphatase MutT (NUDIX family)